MRKESSGERAINVVMTVVMLFLVISAFFIAGSHDNILIRDHIISVLLIVVTAVSVYIMFNNYLFSSSTLMLPLLTLFLAFLSPESIFRYKEGIISLILLWTLFLHVMYGVGEKGYGVLFISYILMSIAVLLLPQLVWLIPLSFLLAVYYKGFNARLLVVMAGGLLTPVLYYLGFLFITGRGAELKMISDSFFRSMTDISLYNPVKYFSPESIVMYIILIITLLSLIYVFVNNKKQNIRVANALNSISGLIIILIIIAFLFWGADIYILHTLVYPSIAMVAYNYFRNNIAKKWVRIILYVFILSIFIVRVSVMTDLLLFR